MFNRWAKLKSSKAILLIGPRRAGKSTLLHTLFPEYKYVTLDDLDELMLAKNDPKNWIKRLGGQFIIDEAQRFPDLAIPLKWAIDELKVKAIITGSTGLNLLQKATETLAGRIEIFYLPPSCFGEKDGLPINFTDWRSDLLMQKESARELDEYLSYGGFPEIVTADNVAEKEKLLKIYKNTYFTKDVADLNSIENLEGLYALYGALITGISSRYEVSSLVKECGLSTPTVKKYLNTLIQSGLLFKLYGYHLSDAKRFISSAKSYFIDTGVVTALSDRTSRAQQVESFVISEIEKRRRLGFINCDHLYYYESVGGREIDLIIDEPTKVTAIEIKSGKTISGRDIRNLREFEIKSKKSLKKIIYYDGHEYYLEDHIEIRPLASLYRTINI